MLRLPPCHSTPGAFPRDISSLKVKLAAPWSILRLSVLVTLLLGEATALGVDAHGTMASCIFPGELHSTSIITVLLQEPLMILINT